MTLDDVTARESILSQDEEFPADGAKLENYEAFIAVVDAGNLTRAAAQLRRSLGSRIYRRVTAALRELGLAEAELRDASGTLSGTLCVAGSAFFIGSYVIPAIGEFRLSIAQSP